MVAPFVIGATYRDIALRFNRSADLKLKKSSGEQLAHGISDLHSLAPVPFA
jgi:hypothetical protein